MEKWISISVKDRGEVISNDWVTVGERDFPFENTHSIPVGNFVRVTGFTEAKLLVVPDTNQTRTLTCQKCGHENIIQ